MLNKKSDSNDFAPFKNLKDEKLDSLLSELRKCSPEASQFLDKHEKEFNEIHQERYVLKTLLNNIPLAVYFKDRLSRFVSVSNNMLKRFNLKSYDQILGKTDKDIQDPIHANEAFEDEIKIVKTGKSLINIVERERFVDGDRWVSSSKMPWKDADGKIIGIYGVSKDVTDLVQAKEELVIRNEELQAAEEELRQNIEELQSIQDELYAQKEKLANQNEKIKTQNNELISIKQNLERNVEKRTHDLKLALLKAEESEQLKSAFLANMSHEIRTPMNSILGFSQLLTEELKLNTQVSQYINLINSSADSLMVLISDILDMSMIEANQIQIRNNKFNLNELMNEVYDSVKHNFINKRLKVSLLNEIESSDLSLTSDALRIKQVLFNLLNNACKFTPKGEVCFGARLVNNSVVFFVKDTGIGIHHKDLNSIFERFVKSENDISKLYRGAGLGLAISKSLALRLGGDLTVESTFDSGSCFYFTLPFSV